jgi:hypothetical protein
VSVAWIYSNLFSTWYSWTIVPFPLSNNYFLAQSWRECSMNNCSAISSREQVTIYSCYTHVKTERDNSCCLAKRNNCSAISSREQVTIYSCYTHVKIERDNSCCLTENEQLCSYIKSRTSYCIFRLHSRQDWARKKLLLSGKWTIVQLYQVENKLLYIHATLTSRLSEKIVVA